MRAGLAGRTMWGSRVIHIVLTAGLLAGLLALLAPALSPPADAAARAQTGASTWTRAYQGSDHLAAQSLMLMEDGDLVVAAQLQSAGLQISRLGPAGEVRWSSTYSGVDIPASDPRSGGIACSPAGMLLFLGDTLLRLNDSGTVRWARSYNIHPPSASWGPVRFTDVVQLADGGFATCGEADDRLFVCRLDQRGTPLWTRSYEVGCGYRSRVFPLAGGGFLVGGTTLTDEMKGNLQGVKLLWLNADGMVQRARAYFDTTTPLSNYGGFVNMAMSTGGPVVCQYRYSVGCFGTNVIQLDSTGGVQWTTWVGGLRRGNAETLLSSVDAAPDGGLLLTGSTTEFSEHTDWGHDGMAERLSPNGAVQWISTVDREIFTPVGLSTASAATDDSGLAWVATKTVSGPAHQSLLVIRMGPGGTAGKLGSYLTQVDIGNARLVRIEHPEMTAENAGRDSRRLNCDFDDLSVGLHDAILNGSEVEGEALSTLTLKPLYPASAATASTIMPGGTLYRYYQVLDAGLRPVPGVEIRFYGPFRNTMLTAESDAAGEIVFSLAVPRNTEPRHYASTLSIQRVRVNGRRAVLAAAPDFATDVVPLSWSTNWMAGSGIAGKAGLGLGGGVFAQGQQSGGMVLTRTAGDPANDGGGSMAITDSLANEATLGVQGEAGKLHLGTVKAKAVDATAKATLSPFIDFATLFNEPSQCSDAQKLAAALTLLCGVVQATSAGTSTLLSFAENALVTALSGDIDMEHITGGISGSITGDVSALAIDFLSKDQGTELSLAGLSLAKLSEGGKAILSITGYPSAGEASGKATLEFSLATSFVEAIGYQVAGYSGASAVSAELVVSPLDTAFERLVLTASESPGNREDCRDTRLIIDRTVVGAAADAVLAQLLALAPVVAPQPGPRLLIDEQFCADALRSLVTALGGIPIPYERVVTQDKRPTSLDIGLGIEIGGTGFDLGVKPTWNRYQSFPLERGVFVALDNVTHTGRMVKLEEYPESLFSAQVDNLADIIGELMEPVGDLLLDVWDVAGAGLSMAAETLLEVGAGVGNAAEDGASALFEAGTSILGSVPVGGHPLLAALPETGVSTVATRQHSDAWPAGAPGPALFAASTTKKITLVGAPAGSGGFCVGGMYSLEPENLTLSKPATLTLRYSAASASGRDPGDFCVYHYDPAGRIWSPVPSTHDPAARTLSATITQTGGYCIGCDTAAPVFTLLLPPGTPAIVTTPVPQLLVGCTDEGSGLEPSTLRATLDGRPLDIAWSPSAGSAALTAAEPLSPGRHTLAVEGSDGSGNRGSATFALEMRVPPGQAALRLLTASPDRIEVHLETGPQETSKAATASYSVWRTGPGPGLAYHRVGTVAGSEGVCTDTDVRAGETYRYVAFAVSQQEVEGPASEPILVEVPPKSTAQTTAPPASTQTTAAAGGGNTTNGATTITAGGQGADSETGGLGTAAWFGIGAAVVIALALAAAGVLVRMRRHG